MSPRTRRADAPDPQSTKVDCYVLSCPDDHLKTSIFCSKHRKMYNPENQDMARILTERGAGRKLPPSNS